MTWFQEEKLYFATPSIAKLYTRALHREFVSTLGGRLVLIAVILLLIITLISPFVFSNDTVYTNSVIQIYSPLSKESLLGTDMYGRDLFKLMLIGLHYSFGSAILLTIANLLVVIPVGTWLGFKTAVHKELIGGVFNLLLSIPTIILAIALISIYHNSLFISMVAIFISSIPYTLKSYVVTVSTQTSMTYVTRLSLDGLSEMDIIRHGLFEKLLPITIAAFRFLLIYNFVDIIILGLVGFGADPALGELGTILHQGWKNVNIASWLITIPNIMIVSVILLVVVFTYKLEKATSTIY